MTTKIPKPLQLLLHDDMNTNAFHFLRRAARPAAARDLCYQSERLLLTRWLRFPYKLSVERWLLSAIDMRVTLAIKTISHAPCQNEIPRPRPMTEALLIRNVFTKQYIK